MSETATLPEAGDRFGFLTYETRDLGNGVEQGHDEYEYRSRDAQGRYVFDSVIVPNTWNVQVRDSGGIVGDFAITASTAAQALRETARNVAGNLIVRSMKLDKMVSERIYLFEDEIVAWNKS